MSDPSKRQDRREGAGPERTNAVLQPADSRMGSEPVTKWPALPTFHAGRVAGAASLILAVATMIAASGYRVGFLTDPIGPRALPWLAATLLGIGGALLMARPGQMPASVAAPRRRIVSLAIGAFVLYAIILPAAGFVVSTGLLMAVLARFYGGRWRQGIAAGAIFSTSLWLLFAQALGVPLPVGLLFLAGG